MICNLLQRLFYLANLKIIRKPGILLGIEKVQMKDTEKMLKCQNN